MSFAFWTGFDACTDSGKATEGNIACILAQISASMSICTRDYCILYHHILTVWKRKKPVLVKNSFDQNTNMHTTCLLLTVGLWLSPGKALVRLVELWAKLTAFFMELHFYLKERLMNYGYSVLSIWQHFLKNEQSVSVTSRKTTDSNCCPW